MRPVGCRLAWLEAKGTTVAIMSHPYGGAIQSGYSVVRRSLRAAGFVFLGHPLALVVGATCLWLLSSLLVGMCRVHAEGVGRGACDMVTCAGVIFLLTFLTSIAVAEVTLMWVEGWRSDRV